MPVLSDATAAFFEVGQNNTAVTKLAKGVLTLNLKVYETFKVIETSSGAPEPGLLLGGSQLVILQSALSCL
jgi:hypothetical protein